MEYYSQMVHDYRIVQFFDDGNIDRFDATSKFSLSIISSGIANIGGLRCCPSILSPSKIVLYGISQLLTMKEAFRNSLGTSQSRVLP